MLQPWLRIEAVRGVRGSPGWSRALAPGAISELVRAVPALALGAPFHGAMRGALGRVVGGMPALGLEPLAGILDLRSDAGEVGTPLFSSPSAMLQHVLRLRT